MKKFWKVFGLVLVVGLFLIQSAWALSCLPHQVKTGETVLSLAEQYSANPERLIIRKLKNYRTIYLDRGDQLFPGETVYVVKEKINSSPKTTETVTPKVVPKTKEPAQKQSPPKITSQKTTQTPAQEKKETGVKTDWEKAVRNWDANVGAYIQRDLDGGSEDNAKRSGKGFYGTFGVFPWEVDLGDRKWKFGPKVRYNQGESSVEKPGYSATYDYRRLEGGLRAETRANNQLYGVEAGVSYQETDKEASPQGQDTWSVHLRGNFEDERRRAEGKKMFPFVAGSIHHRQQISADTEGGTEEHKETQTAIDGRLAIVDLKNGEDENLRFTPEVLGEMGYSQGKDSPFLGIGGGFSVGNKKSDYLQFGFKPRWYTQNEGASRKTFFFNLNPDAIMRSGKANGVKKYDGQSSNYLNSPSPAMEGH
jgi:hypothetical protein